MGCCLNSRQYTRFDNPSEFIELLKTEKDEIKHFLCESPVYQNEIENLYNKKILSELFTTLNYLDKKLTHDKQIQLNREYLNSLISIFDDYYDLKSSKLNDREVNQLKNKINEFIENFSDED
jgi:hypothetical protein